MPDAMPKSVLVIGSGAIGIEFASFYDHMGAEVTVVEVLDRVLPVEDEEISALARKQFEKRGLKIHTDAKVSGARGAATAPSRPGSRRTARLEDIRGSSAWCWRSASPATSRVSASRARG